MPRDDGNEFPQINFYAAGWEIQSVQPKHIFQKQYLKPEDGIEAFFVPAFVTSGWGFEPQLHQPQRIIAKGGAFARDDNGNEFPLINWFNAGWEAQIGHWKYSRRPDLPPLGDTGIEFPFVPPVTTALWGFDAQSYQPQRIAYKAGAIALGDDGTEFRVVGWYNFGWEIQAVQPPWHRTKPGIMPWEDGNEFSQINWQNFGWQLQDFQPNHPRPERFGAMAPWEDGIEASFIFVPPPVNLNVFRPLMGVGI